ncbi:MAG TPA: HD-GYP domain-containing protein [Methylophilaceae bacterium]|nr:HD-GYP domain-containing protein [Methylophilaceae bacterium]HQR60623.1 HD-GYP domain-containing protein [Methylophilaceae bacterium]
MGNNKHCHDWPLHRVLIFRIGATALVMAVAAAAIVYWIERQKLHDTAVELATRRAAEFVAEAGNVFTAPGAAEKGEVQTRLDRFVREHLPPREGSIVAAMVFDAAGTPVARFARAEFAQRSAAEAFLTAQHRASDGIANARARPAEIGGARVYFVQVPLDARDGRMLGRLFALYAPSANYVAEFDRRLQRAIIFAIAAVLASAAVLYPVVLRLMRRVTTLSASLLDANLETIQVLGGAIAKRDADTDAHNYRVTIYSVRLAEVVGLDDGDIQALIKGAFLHDVGKIGIHDQILLKPGRLTPEEFVEMKTHVEHGLDIVRRASWLADAAAVVGSHHEKMAGDGYPNGLAGESIPLAARIFAIADVFDALTSRRPYKEPLSCDEAMNILAQGRGSHFDARLFDAFEKIAPALHAQFSSNDDSAAKDTLAQITERYFRQDVGMLLG